MLLTGNRTGQDLRDDQGRSALHLAARGGHIDAIDSLLALSMDININLIVYSIRSFYFNDTKDSTVS